MRSSRSACPSTSTAPPHHLSFGQRRRVAVATVLAMRPEILVLDEPSSNLDPASRRELADILRGLDVTVLMVTHDLPYALELCPRSVILSDGRVVADGPTRDILADDELMRATAWSCPTVSIPARCRRRRAGNVRPVPGSRASDRTDEELHASSDDERPRPRPRRLEREIEETRLRLAATIDELVDRTSPKASYAARCIGPRHSSTRTATPAPTTSSRSRGCRGFVVLLVVIRKVSS